MPLTTLALLLALAPSAPRADDRSFVALLETRLSVVEDFRCEFEGILAFKGENAKNNPNLGENGLYDSFSGEFLWKSGGDTHSRCLHRYEPAGKMGREQVVVRAAKNEAELYVRDNDAPIGQAAISDARLVNANRSGSYGAIFLLDTIKRLAAQDNLEAEVTNERVDDRRLLVISFSFKEPKQLYKRFWVDPKRGGHAIRQEAYAPGGVVMGRTDIVLGSFNVGGVEVWMPISGIIKGHSVTRGGEPSFSAEPTSIETIAVAHGTMEFNRKPTAKAFTIAYKPGTPISDGLRRLQDEFGKQRRPPRVSKREAETLLRENLARAEAQGEDLVAGSPARDGPGWTSWIVWIFGAAALCLSLVLVLQRRRLGLPP